jgi:hypothetical protein
MFRLLFSVKLSGEHKQLVGAGKGGTGVNLRRFALPERQRLC